MKIIIFFLCLLLFEKYIFFLLISLGFNYLEFKFFSNNKNMFKFFISFNLCNIGSRN